jgi:hypothetical protein
MEGEEGEEEQETAASVSRGTAEIGTEHHTSPV